MKLSPMRALLTLALACTAAGCAAQGGPAPPAAPVRAEDVLASLRVLAADSMEGRLTGTPGEQRAARFLAARLRAYGVEPAYPSAPGDSAYFQSVPAYLVAGPERTPRPVLAPSWEAMDTVPAARRLPASNVVGVIRGSDARLRDEAVVVGAHYDHLGVGPASAEGDSIYNGADDDASGVVAVLEIARALAAGPPPGRTVIFLLTTGEEVGMLGIRWYARDPLVPLERTVADLQIEMIGRPDTAAGGPGRAWLTGYDRSTMGAMLAAAGIPIIPDPRPAQNFFERSDNIVFACRDVPGHTLSSFGLHEDYHTPDDEVERIDAEHMAQVIHAATRAVRLLAGGEAPEWAPGGYPEDACARFPR